MKTPEHQRIQNSAWKAKNPERVVQGERRYHLRVRYFVRLNRRVDAAMKRMGVLI